VYSGLSGLCADAMMLPSLIGPDGGGGKSHVAARKYCGVRFAMGEQLCAVTLRACSVGEQNDVGSSYVGSRLW